MEEKQLMSLEKKLHAEISCFQRHLQVVEWICYIGMDVIVSKVRVRMIWDICLEN